MSNAKSSLKELASATLKLLSTEQKTTGFRNIFYSLIQAILEVISIATVIPLFYLMLNSYSPSKTSLLGEKISQLTQFISWQNTLIIILLAFTFKNIISLWLTHFQTNYIKNISVSLSEQLYKRFYKQPWVEYIQNNSSETVRKIKTTPSDFANYVLYGFLLLITDLCICILMTGFLAWVNYKIMLILLAFCLPVFGLYYIFRKKIVSKIDFGFRHLTPKANILLTQGIDSFAETKIYQKEIFFINRFMKIRDTTAKYLANLVTATSLPSKFFEIATILSFSGLIVYYKVYQTNQQDLIVFIGLLSIAIYRIIPSINRILTSVSQIQAYSYSITELKESFESKINISILAKVNLIFNQTIQFKNVSYQYAESNHFHLHHISTTIHKGDFVILEGPSGAGKTTFIHILAGLINEYTGEIFIDNETLTKESLHSWQTKLGFVPQASTILQGTILSNIAFGEDENNIDLDRIQTALEMTHLKEFVSHLDLQLQNSVSENGLTLSGGQRQRLMLARALYRNPEVLLLDEVTNQLDEENKVIILKTLKALSASGKTIVLASHDYTTRQFANRILRFENGSLREIEQ